jgi:hypothetical protein
MGVKESKIEQDIFLRAQKWHPVGLMFTTKAGGGRPNPRSPWIDFLPEGWSDRTFVIRGHMVGVEVKTKTGSPEKSQLIMARKWALAGIPMIYPRSADEFEELLHLVLPAHIVALPTDEEMALFKEAHADKNPRPWLKKNKLGPYLGKK